MCRLCHFRDHAKLARHVRTCKYRGMFKARPKTTIIPEHSEGEQVHSSFFLISLSFLFFLSFFNSIFICLLCFSFLFFFLSLYIFFLSVFPFPKNVSFFLWRDLSFFHSDLDLYVIHITMGARQAEQFQSMDMNPMVQEISRLRPYRLFIYVRVIWPQRP